MTGKPIILCADDTPSLLEGWKMLLEGNGYEVLTATNAKRLCKCSSPARSTWCCLTTICRK